MKSSVFLLASLLIGATNVPGIEVGPERPNILFICTDDQAIWTIGAYGYKKVKTPNIDRLAREGAIFKNAFTVTPVCSPSRASLFTSRYSSEFGIEDWIDPNKEPNLGLSPAAVGWPELLRGAGYTNMLVGKWHLGTRDEFHPTRQGYHQFFGFRGGGNTPMNPTLEVDGAVKALQGSLPDLLVDRALSFIEDSRNRPFLLSVHFRAPHAPYAPVPEEDSAVYRDLDPTIPNVKGLNSERVKKLTREYYASVHSVDRNLGRLLKKLDENTLTRNTIIVFTSDHGYMIGHHGLWHKGNATWLVEGKQGPRPNMFDDAIRVPLLIRWPNGIEPGSVVERVVANIDLFPTLLEMTGVGTPPNLRISGRSVVPLLKKSGATPVAGWDDTLFGQYDMHHYTSARMRMIRTPDWKLIRHFEANGSDELYHLKVDPNETTNLASDTRHRAVFERLNASLNERMAGIGDNPTK